MALESGQIDKLTREIEEKAGRIENILKNAKWEAAAIKEQVIREGEEIREKILIDSREESKRIFADKMKELDREILAAQEKLGNEIDLFSRKIKEIFI